MGWSPILFRRSKLNINIFTAYNRWLSDPRWMGTRGTFLFTKIFIVNIHILNISSIKVLGYFIFSLT